MLNFERAEIGIILIRFLIFLKVNLEEQQMNFKRTGIQTNNLCGIENLKSTYFDFYSKKKMG